MWHSEWRDGDESDEYGGVGDLDDAERMSQMRAMFEQLGGLSEAEQLQALREMILEMAEQATDAQYVRLCGTNLTLAASMPDEHLKPFLAARMTASASLPAPYADRDRQHVEEAIGQADPDVRTKITRNL